MSKASGCFCQQNNSGLVNVSLKAGVYCINSVQYKAMEKSPTCLVRALRSVSDHVLGTFQSLPYRTGLDQILDPELFNILPIHC